MKRQQGYISVPREDVKFFMRECLDKQVPFSEVDTVDNCTRYRVEYMFDHELFYLGQAIGMRIANRQPIKQ